MQTLVWKQAMDFQGLFQVTEYDSKETLKSLYNFLTKANLMYLDIWFICDTYFLGKYYSFNLINTSDLGFYLVKHIPKYEVPE